MFYIYTKLILYRTLRALEAGLDDVWKKKYIPSIDRCKLENHHDSDAKPKPIKLFQLSSAFLILGFGISLAFVAFLVEEMASHLRIGKRKIEVL